MRSLLFCCLLLGAPAFAADAIDQKLEKVLYPGVRVRAGNAQGSGTVVYSEDREKTGEYQTFVLTNHHVVRRLITITRVWDNLESKWKDVEKNDLADVELFSYANGGRTITASTVSGSSYVVRVGFFQSSKMRPPCW